MKFCFEFNDISAILSLITGIPSEYKAFVEFCIWEYYLKIITLMCWPEFAQLIPNDVTQLRERYEELTSSQCWKTILERTTTLRRDFINEFQYYGDRRTRFHFFMPDPNEETRILQETVNWFLAQRMGVACLVYTTHPTLITWETTGCNGNYLQEIHDCTTHHSEKVYKAREKERQNR